MNGTDYRNGDRIAAAALVAAAAGSVFAMAHHPVGGHGGALGPIVHGAMIVLLAVTTFGFAWFAVRRGLDRPAILAGLVAYAIALLGHVGAATINGFAVPALAARQVTDHGLFLLAWELNQALAKLGVFATGAAFILWSIDFLRRAGLEAKAIGALGLLAGAVPAGLLAAGLLRMDVAGAFIVYAAHASWAALVGWHLWRGRLERNPPAG